MIMYYPAGSTLEMGPTCILPGGQVMHPSIGGSLSLVWHWVN
jgi:hypothetical protein